MGKPFLSLNMQLEAYMELYFGAYCKYILRILPSKLILHVRYVYIVRVMIIMCCAKSVYLI